MSDADKTDTLSFTDEDFLQLQQLLTRKALSEAAESGPSSDIATSETEDERSFDLNPSWRLLPDNFNLYDWQSRCLEIWLRVKRGTVKVATGGGKTLFALAAAQALQNSQDPELRLVIVVPTIPLMFQWRDELKSSNLPPSQIVMMGGGENPSDLRSAKVLIAVLNSAREKLPALIAKASWSKNLLLVVDECHRANAAEARKIFDVGAAYTLGLSATPETENNDEGVSSDENYAQSEVGKALGPIIFDFSLKESRSAGLLAEFEVWHIGLSLEPDEAAKHAKISREISELHKSLKVQHRRSRSKQAFIAWCQTSASRGTSSDAIRFMGLSGDRKRLLYKAKSRSNFTIRALQGAMRDTDRRAIVFHESIDEINALFDFAIRAQLPAVLEHSKLPPSLRTGNIEAFRRGAARIIISGKSLVEGFNVPSADIGIIAASSSSIRQRIQSLGRMLRKKQSERMAIIFVLYIRDTEDESIYERADWESVIGAEQNRYFIWNNNHEKSAEPGDIERLRLELEDTRTPPRVYRPPCHEIDTSNLKMGENFPGQIQGLDVRVDQSNNLRSLEGELVSAPLEFSQKIVSYNIQKRARITPCGQLICRASAERQREDDWVFIGDVEAPKPVATGKAQKLAIKQISGRRVIVKKVGRSEVYARGPDKAKDQSNGATRDGILNWALKTETELSLPIRDLFWDGGNSFWLEVNGEKITYDEPHSSLEFPE